MSAHLHIGSVAKVFGRLVLIEAALMLVPLLTCLAYGESDYAAFAIATAITLACGLVTEVMTRNVPVSLHLREGCIVTALIWAVFSIFGMLPFLLCAHPLSPVDALYETVSGFTTTGASVIMNVEQYSHGILLWRALTQWVGGLGIILFMLAVIPALNKNAGISLFNAESTGITHSKIHPRIRQTALSIWGIYAWLTIIFTALMFMGPMNFFDAVCQTMTTVATGGFVTHDNGFMFWDSDYLYYITIVGMFIGGTNFLLLYGLVKGKIRALWKNDVFRAYVAIIIFVYLFFLTNAVLRGQANSVREALIYPLFHVVSALTSTGFAVPGVGAWGSFAFALTLPLMFIGACGGSTTGGMKIDRIMVLRQNVINEAKKMIFPRRTYVVTLNGNSLDMGLVSRITAFVTVYVLMILMSTLIVTLLGIGFDHSLFVCTSAASCNGLGYEMGDAAYALLPTPAKWVMILNMLIGRLEFFTYLVLFMPAFWHK